MFSTNLEEPEDDEHKREQKIAQKKRDKFINALLLNEKSNKPDQKVSNLFDAQMITIASPIWGDIIITKDYFFFASFGLDNPDNK